MALPASAIEVATSGNGRYAFVTLEYDQQAAVFNLAGAVSRGFGSALALADLQRAETDPAHSAVATVDAGCQPVRVVTAANGTQVWVTARATVAARPGTCRSQGADEALRLSWDTLAG